MKQTLRERIEVEEKQFLEDLEYGSDLNAFQKHIDLIESLYQEEVAGAQQDAYVKGVKFGWKSCFKIITETLATLEAQDETDKRLDEAVANFTNAPSSNHQLTK